MANFDFIDVTNRGYHFMWKKRQEIVRLMLVPAAIKFVLFIAIVFLGFQDNYLRQGLVLLPGYFAEGWFLASVVRLAVLGEHWPRALTGDRQDDMTLIESRKHAMTVSILIYALIKIVSAVIVGSAMLSYDSQGEEATQAVPLGGMLDFYLVALAGFMILIWAFRYMWVYIPPALGYGVKDFLMTIRGFKSSFQLMGVWIISFSPVFIVLMVVTDTLETVFPTATLTSEHAPFVILFAGFQTAIELFVSGVTSAAVAYAVVDSMRKKQG